MGEKPSAVEIQHSHEAMNAHRAQFVPWAFSFQVILIILFGTLCDYSDSAMSTASDVTVQTEVDHYYPFYQDVHVMIFIGFGFLMTFLKKYTFSSVGMNFLISAFAIQWSMIVNGVAHNVYVGHPKASIELGITNLITSDFAAGAVLITFGAVLGKTTPLQMLIVVIFELLIYTTNEVIGASILGAVDMGGSIFVHTFGAYFGLALSRVISSPKKGRDGEIKDHPLNGSSYNSDTFAMVGTLFLWMFWPSFNGALAQESQQHRVIINTVLALSACCVAAFFTDAMLRPHNKFDMVSIQNATLAGGVAVGSSSDLVIQPWGALTVGAVAGAFSVFGYVYIQPYLARKWNLDDTCGVHNLHGLPGIIGGLGGAISAATASDTAYGASIGLVFPRRAPTTVTDDMTTAGIDAGDGLSASQQASIQVAALFITLGFAIVGGTIVGHIIKAPIFLPPNTTHPKITESGASSNPAYWYNDEHYWEVPEDGDEETGAAEEAMQKAVELEMVKLQIAAHEEKRTALEADIKEHHEMLGITGGEASALLKGEAAAGDDKNTV
jgi:ammonium transporter Rh